MFGLWRRPLDMDDVPCPSNDHLRRFALAASVADDPKRRLLDLLDEASQFSPPKWLVEREWRAIWSMLRADARAGILDREDVGKSKSQLKSEYFPIAQRRVRLGLVLAEIGRRNHVDSSLRGAAYENEVVDRIFALPSIEPS